MWYVAMMRGVSPSTPPRTNAFIGPVVERHYGRDLTNRTPLTIQRVLKKMG